MTDSGGIQEEAMSLGKRVLILRDVTERIEGLWAGLGKLAGTDENLIYEGLSVFCSSEVNNEKNEIFGNGSAVERIIQILKIKMYPSTMEKRFEKIG